MSGRPSRLDYPIPRPRPGGCRGSTLDRTARRRASITSSSAGELADDRDARARTPRDRRRSVIRTSRALTFGPLVDLAAQGPDRADDAKTQQEVLNVVGEALADRRVADLASSARTSRRDRRTRRGPTGSGRSARRRARRSRPGRTSRPSRSPHRPWRSQHLGEGVGRAAAPGADRRGAASAVVCTVRPSSARCLLDHRQDRRPRAGAEPRRALGEVAVGDQRGQEHDLVVGHRLASRSGAGAAAGPRSAPRARARSPRASRRA